MSSGKSDNQKGDREQILAAIRRSLGASRPAIRALAGSAPPVRPQLDATGAQLVELFCTELHTLNGVSYRCSSLRRALGVVESIMERHQSRQALAWNDDQLPSGLADALRARGMRLTGVGVAEAADRKAELAALAQLQISLSGADAAIAQTGSIAVVSGAGRPRIASLLAPVHIALLPAALIVPALDDAVDLLRARFGPELASGRSNFTFISGPSRTADIEQTLTLGAHGPKELHVVIMEGECSAI